MVEKRPAQEFAAAGRLDDFVDVKLFVTQPLLAVIIQSQVSVMTISLGTTAAEDPGEDLLSRQTESVAIEKGSE